MADRLGNLGVAPSVEQLMRQGQAFGGTSGKLPLAATGNAGVALWKPGTSGWKVFVSGVQMIVDNAMAFGVVVTLAEDPSWTAAVIHNKHRCIALTPGAVLEATTTAGAAPGAGNVAV